MNLTEVARKAAAETGDILDVALSDADIGKVTAIIAHAMERAVQEASSLHSSVCTHCLGHDRDLAHKIRQEMERKKIALVANLSSLR